MNPGTFSRLYTGLLAVSLLAGCATGSSPVSIPVDTSYYLQLKQPFENLDNGTYIDFQQGQRILPGNLDRWTTYCRLYVYNHERGADYVTSIFPGKFSIREVKIRHRSSDYPDNLQSFRLSRGIRDLPAYYLYQVDMRLGSADQPEVRSLTCAKKWAVARANKYPTLSEIRTALGNHALISQ